MALADIVASLPAGLSELVIAGWQADELAAGLMAAGSGILVEAVHAKASGRCDAYCRLCCRVDRSWLRRRGDDTALSGASLSWAGQTGREMITIEAISESALAAIAEIEAELFEKPLSLPALRSLFDGQAFTGFISFENASRAGYVLAHLTQDQAEILSLGTARHISVGAMAACCWRH